MSLGLGIFASVVLVLAVYHKGFRKVLFWTSGAVVVLTLLGAGGYFAYERYTTWQADRVAQKQQAARDKGIRACMSRLGTPWIADSPTVWDVHGNPLNGVAVPKAYFNNLQACTIVPDDYDPYAEFGGGVDRAALEKSLPSGYALDQAGRVISLGLVPKADEIDCYDSQGNLLPDESKAFGGTIAQCGSGETAKPISERAHVPPAKLQRAERIEACEKRVGADPKASPAEFQACRETISSQPSALPKDTRVLKANVTCDVIVYDRDEYAGGDREAIDSLHAGDVVEYIGVAAGQAPVIRVHGRKGYVVDLPGCIEVIP